MENKFIKWTGNALSYVLVAALSCVVTLAAASFVKQYGSIVPLGAASAEVEQNAGKLEELLNLIDTAHVADGDLTVMTDAAASAMLAASGDPWSYYISADEMESHNAQMENAYVGIGVTISTADTSKGFLIERVEPNGSAQKAGILPGDILIEAQGQSLIGMDTQTPGSLIRGKEGTEVTVKVLRGEQTLTFTMKREKIVEKVATGTLLQGNVGYIIIKNFNERCAAETIACIEDLIEQGATKLLFDVRFNGGGYKSELVDLLDYLLPEGKLFISEDYTGAVETDTSNASCLRMPMAVLMNSYSYSAAEFFAAALEEYGWATTVGQHTVGKGYFQYTIPLSDGSAVALSVGKYYTPVKEISLGDTGGLVPNVEVEVDEETEALIYAGLLDPMEDPQVLAALAELR